MPYYRIYTVLGTIKLTLFSFLLKNEDAYFREQRRQKKPKPQKKKTKTQKSVKNARAKNEDDKNEDAKDRISVGAFYKSLQIINNFLCIENI